MVDKIHALQSITFLASFPPIQSAIKIHGSGEGMRIQLEVPETEIPQVIPLLIWREQLLEVTIRIANDATRSDKKRRF